MEPKAYRKELIGKILVYICRVNQCQNVLKFEQCLSWPKPSVEDDVSCILHMHKHLI
jgi:hypothetical protein